MWHRHHQWWWQIYHRSGSECLQYHWEKVMVMERGCFLLYFLVTRFGSDLFLICLILKIWMLWQWYLSNKGSKPSISSRFCKTVSNSISSHCMKDKCWSTHWSMHFAHSNLPVSVACIVLSNHASDKLWCLQDVDSLLCPTPYIFSACMVSRPWRSIPLLDGNNGCFIHSSKATRLGFSVHEKVAFQWVQKGEK